MTTPKHPTFWLISAASYLKLYLIAFTWISTAPMFFPDPFIAISSYIFIGTSLFPWVFLCTFHFPSLGFSRSLFKAVFLFPSISILILFFIFIFIAISTCIFAFLSISLSTFPSPSASTSIVLSTSTFPFAFLFPSLSIFTAVWIFTSIPPSSIYWCSASTRFTFIPAIYLAVFLRVQP